MSVAPAGSGGSSALQTEWARLLMTSLADAGVRHVVASPGSRSTPFVVAASEEPRFTITDVVDERAAAYYALGLGRAAGHPALLLCTSGTAAANYLPAIAEAAASFVPLVALTADRPPELHGCGANQTLDQTKLFGDHVRRFVDLGTADGGDGALRALRRTAAQAVATALHPLPGPVHLDARARKPLEPPRETTDADRALGRRVDAVLARPSPPPAVPTARPPADAVAALAAACRQGGRGLLVAGPAPLAHAGLRDTVARLARCTGFPVLADATSQLRFGREQAGEQDGVLWVDGAGTVLAAPAWRERLRAERVIQLGHGLTATAWEGFLAGAPPAEHWVLARHGWPDPASTATRMLPGDLGETLAALLADLGAADDAAPPAASGAYRDAWSAAGAAVAAAVAAELADDVWSEAAATAELVAALPADGVLGVGNSLPIRWLDAVCGGGAKPLRVVSQRGVSGIDGVVAAFAGSAWALRRPAGLVVGDLGFLHDLGGLALLRHAAAPLVVLVLHNRGGRIFEQLPIADGHRALDHWTTPHDLELAPAAALYRLAHRRVTTRAELRAALAEALRRPAATVVEAVVPPHGAAEVLARLRARVAAAAGDD